MNKKKRQKEKSAYWKENWKKYLIGNFDIEMHLFIYFNFCAHF